MGPGVRADCLNPMRQPSLKLDLQRVVIGCAGVDGQEREDECAVRLKDTNSLNQAPSYSPEVSGGHTLMRAERLLERDVPLPGVRELQIWIEQLHRAVVAEFSHRRYGTGNIRTGRRKRTAPKEVSSCIGVNA